MARPSSRRGRPDAGRTGRRPAAVPTLRLERRLLRSGVARLGGDGRGRAAGRRPARSTSGWWSWTPRRGRPPAGIRDSKLLAAGARASGWCPRIEAWAAAGAVGTRRPRRDRRPRADRCAPAGRRAGARRRWDRSAGPGAPRREPRLADRRRTAPAAGPARPVVRTRVKADLHLHLGGGGQHPGQGGPGRRHGRAGRGAIPAYGWEANKGYGTEAHLAAIRRLGTTPHHRLSWRLPERA